MLSVIIVNFNGVHLLPQCLASLYDNVPSDTEIIIHDNGSTDGSIALLRDKYPNIRLSISATNLGFAGGNNAAAALAQGDILLLLNSDTVVLNDIRPMIDMLSQDPSIGALGCRLIYENGRQQESIGQNMGPIRLALSWTPLARISSWFRRTAPAHSSVYTEVDNHCYWVSGACLMTTLDCWRKIGGLDKNYFMYMEDVDFCDSVRNNGLRVSYTSATTVLHLEGGGRPWIGRKAVLDTAVSYRYYARKHYSVAGQIFLRLLLPVVWSFRAISHAFAYIFRRDEFGFEKFKAFGRAIVIILYR